ncbi:MAG: hypothetical protein OEW00_05950 [candidate division Zixibacteria bacterium]|nr:hypothetical protein [candidate division Zixibacteria bacterium]
MTIERIKLRIATPIEPIVPGRGFYQLEEDALYVQVGLFSAGRRFYSFLESKNVLLDFDRLGRLIFIEVRAPRRQWKIDSDLKPPAVAQPADIRWLNFRDTIAEPGLFTNCDKSSLLIRFSAETTTHNYYLADSIILRVDAFNRPVSIWADEIVDDLAGLEIAAFRKAFRGEPLLSPVTASA